MKKFALALMSAAALVFGFGVVANAQYGTTGDATATPANPGAGEPFLMTLDGCQVGETVSFVLTFEGTTIDTATATCLPAPSGTPLGSIIGLLAQAPATGSASAELTLGTEPGTYIATATGQTSGVTSSLTFVIEGTAGGGTDNGGTTGGATTDGTTALPATGSDGIATTTGIAIGLLVVGLGLFAVAQIRRRQTTLA